MAVESDIAMASVARLVDDPAAAGITVLVACLGCSDVVHPVGSCSYDPDTGPDVAGAARQLDAAGWLVTSPWSEPNPDLRTATVGRSR